MKFHFFGSANYFHLIFGAFWRRASLQDGTFGCTRWHHGLCSEHLVAGGKQPNTCRRCGLLWWIFFQRHEAIVHGFIWLHELHAEGIFMTCFSFEGRYINDIIMILMAILLSVPVVLMLVSNCRQFWTLDWHSCNMVIDGNRNGTESTTAGLSLNTVTHSSNQWDVPRRHFWHLFFFPLGSVFFGRRNMAAKARPKAAKIFESNKKFWETPFWQCS